MKIAIRDEFVIFDAKVAAILDFSQNSKKQFCSALHIDKMQLCTKFQKARSKFVKKSSFCNNTKTKVAAILKIFRNSKIRLRGALCIGWVYPYPQFHCVSLKSAVEDVFFAKITIMAAILDISQI